MITLRQKFSSKIDDLSYNPYLAKSLLWVCLHIFVSNWSLLGAEGDTTVGPTGNVVKAQWVMVGLT